MDTTRAAGHLEELAETLWRERHLTEQLLYKLVCTRLILAADDERFVGTALNEVDHVLAALRTAEIRRDDVVQALAVTWGIAVDDLSLAALVEHASEPWATIFDDHRRSFLALTTEIEDTARENRRLAASGLQRVQQTMLALTDGRSPTATYDPRGQTRLAATGSSLVDEAL